MINKLRIGTAGVVFAAALGMSSTAFAQDSVTADATAEILDSLTLEVDTTDSVLDFGQMVLATGNPNSVTLPATGAISCDGTDIVCSGTASQIRFNITAGTVGKDVDVTLQDTSVTPVTLLRVGGTGGVSQDEIELHTLTTSAATITLAGTAADTFTVGGTIDLDGDETPGVFDGQFTVSVAYQ